MPCEKILEQSVVIRNVQILENFVGNYLREMSMQLLEINSMKFIPVDDICVIRMTSKNRTMFFFINISSSSESTFDNRMHVTEVKYLQEKPIH